MLSHKSITPTGAETAHPQEISANGAPPAPEADPRLVAAITRIVTTGKEGLGSNLRRQLDFLGITDGEFFALQTLPPNKGGASYTTLVRTPTGLATRSRVTSSPASPTCFCWQRCSVTHTVA